MRFYESLLVALSTYSAVPVPQFIWNEQNMKYAICFFPAVGLLCGGGLGLWCWLGNYFAVSPVLFAAVGVCIPLLVTGGIHMDGYMDTVDALASHQSRERKLEIMKDSNSGAFAVIYCGVYLLLSFGLLHEIYLQGTTPLLCPVFVLSRGLSACCAVNLPNARKSGMLCAFTQDADRKIASGAMGALIVLCCGWLVALAPVSGSLGSVASLLAVAVYLNMAIKHFGGITGDTSGFFLQICELAAMAGIWLGGLL